jgi:hypothetical protein
LFWLAAVFGDKLPANWNRCHHPRHHHMRQRHPHTMHRGHMHLRHILEANHMHQRHPQTHNMKTKEDMKTEEDEGNPQGDAAKLDTGIAQCIHPKGRMPLANSTQQEQLAVLHVQSVRWIGPPQPPDTAYPMSISSLEAPVPHVPGLLNAQG